MMMPTKSRKKILTKLFQDGVMFAKKDPGLLKHPEFPDIPNLHVMKLMQSLKSKDHVTEVFSWQHYYWTLTDAGVESLRDALHLPATIVPSTHKKAATETARLPMTFGGDRSAREGGARPERDGYRSKPAFSGSVRGRGNAL